MYHIVHTPPPLHPLFFDEVSPPPPLPLPPLPLPPSPAFLISWHINYLSILILALGVFLITSLLFCIAIIVRRSFDVHQESPQNNEIPMTTIVIHPHDSMDATSICAAVKVAV
jgi:hypothetical protein